jgi:hypothetical protein
MSFVTGGSFPASLVPAQNRMALQSNYLTFDGGAGGNFAQQYLPELYEAEVERYGNRTIGGFLRMVGAEMPMTSDQVIWSEQNRLHVAYKGVTSALVGGGNTTDITVDLNITAAENPSLNGAVRQGQTILLSDVATGLVTAKALVQTVTNGAGAATSDILTCTLYETTAANFPTGLLGAAACNVFVYGSEFGKGMVGMEGSIEPNFTQYHNSPLILKDNFKISGSDAAQIGWVEVSTEDGQSGYLWYLKSESETRLRFEDYLEMAMIEGELMTNAGVNFQYGPAGGGSDIKGTEGLFAAIEARGNVYSGFAGAAAPGSGALGDFDEILKNLDKQGAIEENMLFLSRSTALDFDDMIAAVNGGLNDASLRGLDKEIDGVLVPAGTTTVYDQMLGSNIRRPFLHVRYRASETEDRRMKSWVTGSVGGAYTDTLDAMTVSFLSERCLVTQAANNFVLFKGA